MKAACDLQRLEMAFPFILLYVARDGKRFQAAYPEEDGKKLFFESSVWIDARAGDKMELAEPDVMAHVPASHDDSPSKRSRTTNSAAKRHLFGTAEPEEDVYMDLGGIGAGFEEVMELGSVEWYSTMV